MTLMSNFLNPYEMTTRRQKVKGSSGREIVGVPVMVRMYNYYMGGVDLADQLKEAYEIDIRAKYKYYLRLFLICWIRPYAILTSFSKIQWKGKQTFPRKSSDRALFGGCYLLIPRGSAYPQKLLGQRNGA